MFATVLKLRGLAKVLLEAVHFVPCIIPKISAKVNDNFPYHSAHLFLVQSFLQKGISFSFYYWGKLFHIEWKGGGMIRQLFDRSVNKTITIWSQSLSHASALHAHSAASLFVEQTTTRHDNYCHACLHTKMNKTKAPVVEEDDTPCQFLRVNITLHIPYQGLSSSHEVCICKTTCTARICWRTSMKTVGTFSQLGAAILKYCFLFSSKLLMAAFHFAIADFVLLPENNS